jgi:Uma2 family endonuclease
MSTVLSSLSESPHAPSWAPTVELLYRLSLEQYEAMVDSGIFHSGDRFYLIDGLLVSKVTKKPPHVLATEKARRALAAIIPSGWYIRSEVPVRIPPASEPEPDISVVTGTPEDYADRHPGPLEIALIVEISYSSIAKDRGLARIYGTAGVASYWLIDLIGREVVVHATPGPEGYHDRAVFSDGDFVPVWVSGRELGRIAVADLLP